MQASAVIYALLAVSCAAAPAEVTLRGRVIGDTGAPVAGARVKIASLDPPGERQIVTADAGGALECRLPREGAYSVSVEREGFFTLQDRVVRLAPGVTEIQFELSPLREIFESIEVSARSSTVDLDRSAPEKTLRGTDILAVPYPTTNNLKNALRILPGVVHDSRGGVHVNGGAEDQTLYTLDGFTLNDPLTGRLESRVSVEAVQSVEILSGAPAAEYGRGSAGTLAVSTVSGSDRWRYVATNFVPGIENRKGIVIGDWTPRAGVSGPLVPGRAWFSNSVSTQYVKHVVEELPDGEDRSADWRLTNLLHTQVNLTPSHILYGGFLVNRWNAPRTGLNPLDPMETTTDRRSRQWFFHVKDQVYLAGGGLIEAGFARDRTFAREIPQGPGPYLLTPDGKRGNNYTDAARKGGREQFIANGVLPALRRAGSHRVKAGVDLNRLSYWQDVRRSGYEHLRADLTPSVSVVFRGSGRLRRENTEAAWYVQDSWKVRPSLLFELGLRSDWDRLLGNTTFSPRMGFAWSPRESRDSKIFGGYAVVHEPAALRLFARPADQVALATYFGPDGEVLRGPAATVFEAQGPFRTPRYQTSTLGFERRFPGGLESRIAAIRKRGRLGLAYLDVLAPEVAAIDAIYRLGNHRVDVYDAVEIAIRQPLRQQYEWMAGYTRSNARSNSVADVSADDPFLYPDNFGPMPWDTPNRLVSWGYLPTFWKNWAAAYLLEVRDGFPFSVVGGDGRAVGRMNSRRFPLFVELNLHAERRFVLRGHRWAFRCGFNNLTNRRNPNVVNNNLDSARFGQFLGGQHRSLNFRIRWLGRR
ncbi:MAG: TonB-dependent receptor [Acidobacteria bacterium]|nr:TonB-dependent receptor [Acidobacteriota bacterium]